MTTLTDDELRERIEANRELPEDHPMRNDVSMAMAEELLIHRELRASETSRSIADWQNATFGEATTTLFRVCDTNEAIRDAMHSALVAVEADHSRPRPNLSRAIRAAEELAELIELLVTDDNAAKAPEEVADIDIVLRGIDGAHGVERSDTVDAKMAKNRARRWVMTGDGHGQHVKDEP